MGRHGRHAETLRGHRSGHAVVVESDAVGGTNTESSVLGTIAMPCGGTIAAKFTKAKSDPESSAASSTRH